MKRCRTILITAAVLVGIAAFAVDRAADVIARRSLLDALRKTFATEVAVDDVAVDVLALGVRVRGLRIADVAGFGPEPLLEVAAADGGVASGSSLFGAPEIRLTVAPGSVLRLRFAPDGKLNLAAARRPPGPRQPRGEQRGALLREVALDGMRVEIEDQRESGDPVRLLLENVELRLNDLTLGTPRDGARDADLRVSGGFRSGDGELAPFALVAAISPSTERPAPMQLKLAVIGFDLDPLQSHATQAKTLLGGRFVDVDLQLAVADRRCDGAVEIHSSGGERFELTISGPADAPGIDDSSGLLAALQLPVEKARRLGRAALDVADAATAGGERSIDVIADAAGAVVDGGGAVVDGGGAVVDAVVGGAQKTAEKMEKMVERPQDIPGDLSDAASAVGKGTLDFLKGAVEAGKDVVTGAAETVTSTVAEVAAETADQIAARRRGVENRYHAAVLAVLEYRAAIARDQGDEVALARIAEQVVDENARHQRATPGA